MGLVSVMTNLWSFVANLLPWEQHLMSQVMIDRSSMFLVLTEMVPVDGLMMVASCQ